MSESHEITSIIPAVGWSHEDRRKVDVSGHPEWKISHDPVVCFALIEVTDIFEEPPTIRWIRAITRFDDIEGKALDECVPVVDLDCGGSCDGGHYERIVVEATA